MKQKIEHQDMLEMGRKFTPSKHNFSRIHGIIFDKETALEDVLRGLDIKYKALNRSLSVREANLK